MIWPVFLKTPQIQKAGWRLARLHSCTALAPAPCWPPPLTCRCCPCLRCPQEDPHLLLPRRDAAVSLGQGWNPFFPFLLQTKIPPLFVLLGLLSQMCQELVLVKQPNQGALPLHYIMAGFTSLFHWFWTVLPSPLGVF